MKRTKLSDRKLPDYTRAEECMNMVTHIVGGVFGILALTLSVIRAALHGNVMGVVTCAIYGACMIALYTMSSVYHGLCPGMGKRVMQVVDHCTIYFLIAGTYTPLVLCAIRPRFPVLGWSLFGAEWALALAAAVLTAIDLRKYKALSMVCYIGMGWGIVLFLPQAIEAIGAAGFWILFAGGVAYTIGAVLYGIGHKRRWMHSVFHLFVLLGSMLQYITIYEYVI